MQQTAFCDVSEESNVGYARFIPPRKRLTNAAGWNASTLRKITARVKNPKKRAELALRLTVHNRRDERLRLHTHRPFRKASWGYLFVSRFAQKTKSSVCIRVFVRRKYNVISFEQRKFYNILHPVWQNSVSVAFLPYR